MIKTTYSEAILSGFDYLLKNYPEVFVLGQGLWSPWYVGNTMKNLDKKYGKERIIDTPVSESACTGAAVGASLCGMKPVIVHPRMDFMLYSMDAIVNQAAKWSYMFGGKNNPSVTIRAIIYGVIRKINCFISSPTSNIKISGTLIYSHIIWIKPNKIFF